jgi:hypothetical protein
MKVVRGHIDTVLLCSSSGTVIHYLLLLGFDDKFSRSRKSIARDIKMELQTWQHLTPPNVHR